MRQSIHTVGNLALKGKTSQSPSVHAYIPPKEKHTSLHQGAQDLVGFVVVSVSILIMVCTAIHCISLKTQEQELSIAIKQAQTRLQDVRNQNSELIKDLPVYSREYIQSNAIGRLGMAYPDQNTTYCYTPVRNGYVRQYRFITKDSE